MSRHPAWAACVTRTHLRRRVTFWVLSLLVGIIGVLPILHVSEAGVLAIDFQNPLTIYTATQRGIFKSDDGGSTWAARNTGFPISERLPYVNALVMDPVNPKILYAGTQDLGVLKTTDGAQTWVRTNTHLASITALAVDPPTPTTLYAAAGQGTAGSPGRVDHLGRIYKSTDGGVTWRPSSAGVADPWISILAIAPQKPHTVYARTESGIFRMTHRSGEWIPVNTGLPNPSTLRILALVADPRDPRIVYAGTATHGIFKSIDGGQNWRAVNAGLSAPEIVAAPPDPGLSRGRIKLIETLAGPGRPIIEGLGIGERTDISRPEDCNTCRCAVRRISPTEYLELECVCTLIGCAKP